MNGKELIKAFLNKQPVTRIPYVPCIDPYFRAGLPDDTKKMDLFELQKACGTDMFRGLCTFSLNYDEHVTYTKEVAENSITETFKTPLGTLREVKIFTPESPYIPFPTEYLVKTMDDLAILRYIYNHTLVEPNYEFANEIIQKYPEIMASSSVENTPFMHLMTKIIVIENFVYFYFENPEEIEITMDCMLELNKKQLEVSALSPVEVFICYENTNTLGSSIDWIRQYEIPQLNEFARIMRQHNKTMLVHMCGCINMVIEDIAQAEFDGIIDVTPPPTGDLDLAYAARIMAANGKILAGGIECNQFCQTDAHMLKGDIIKILDNAQSSGIFMLGSGDAVPKGTPLQHVLLGREILGNF